MWPYATRGRVTRSSCHQSRASSGMPLCGLHQPLLCGGINYCKSTEGRSQSSCSSGSSPPAVGCQPMAGRVPVCWLWGFPLGQTNASLLVDMAWAQHIWAWAGASWLVGGFQVPGWLGYRARGPGLVQKLAGK